MSEAATSVVLTAEALDAVLEHVALDAPREAVGFLGGRDSGHADLIVKLQNVFDGPGFLVHPREQFFAERGLAQDGRQVVATYHSHPGGGTDLSAEDRQFLEAWTCLHLVVSLNHARYGIACYRIQARAVTRVSVSVEIEHGKTVDVEAWIASRASRALTVRLDV